MSTSGRHAESRSRSQVGPDRRLGPAVAAAVVVAVVLGATLVAVLSAAGGATSQAAGAQARSSAATTAPARTPAVPVYAYFYQWFTESSWDRAKKDFPVAGRYSSDDIQVLRAQVRQAKSAGIDGFITSWKSTTPLNRRLDRLVQVAKEQDLDLGVVYQALDFYRDPLPIETIRRDMVYLVERWGDGVASSYYGRPVIIWTGTDQFSREDVQSVREALGERAYLLAASRSVEGYERVADLVDGEAYYWSSADPESAMTLTKLHAFSDAVHANGGLWFAPAAPGYDGTTLGGERVIDRQEGATLRRSLANAFESGPDAVAVISWNEWSENTYIEPGLAHGDRELQVLRDSLVERSGIDAWDLAAVDSSDATSSRGLSARQALVVLVLLAGAFLVLVLLRVRGRRRGAEDSASA